MLLNPPLTALKATLEFLHRLLVAIAVAAAVNVVFLLAHGGEYDFRIGFAHLVAHGAFKPLLILNGAFLLAAVTGKPREAVPGSAGHTGAHSGVLAALGALALLELTFSCTVNPLYDEWNYRALSATYPTLGGAAHLFLSSQIGVWYRPLGFVSLWLDRALFHDHVWAYHLQNIFLHCGNAWLAMLLAKRLGLSKTAARWAGVLYLTAAITYEPVMWPSARFDLWAMLFTIAALLASARFLSGAGGKSLAAALACYALAVCSKESGYAYPLLLAIMALTAPFENKPPDRKPRLIQLGAGVLIVTLAMLAIRKAVLGGAGGYPGTATTPSIHLSFSLATIRIVLARAMQMSLLSVNLSYPTPAVMLAVISAFALVLAVAALAGASLAPRRSILAVYVFAATLPVAPLISWLDFHAQHVRYLYMPAAFVTMLAAAALSNARRPAVMLFAFGALNLCCGFYNTWVYKTTYRNSAMLAGRIAADLEGQPAQVKIVGMPEEYNGVLFSRFELEYRLREMLSGVEIEFDDKGVCSVDHCYIWQPEQQSLQRFGEPLKR
jgi:hypothetical protein